MTDLLVVFNSSNINSLEKLNTRRLYTVSFRDYIKYVQREEWDSFIQGQISPESESNFYSLQICNITPLFLAEGELKGLYKELFQSNYKSTYLDLLAHSGYFYMENFIEEYTKPIIINNKLKDFYNAKVYNTIKFLETYRRGKESNKQISEKNLGDQNGEDAIQIRSTRITISEVMSESRVEFREYTGSSRENRSIKKLLQECFKDL